MIRTPFFNIIYKIAIIILLFSAQATAAESFPQFEVIDQNVSFWKQVYSQYSTTQAIVHDSVNPAIIYDIVKLKPYDAPGARKINRKRMKRAKVHYQRILKRLANNPNNKNSDCQQVAMLFGPGASAKTFSKARQRIRCQIGQKDRFARGLIRSGAYIDQIRKIFRSYGLPEDLAYLPHVESSFNTKAYSKFGAAGIWQFTRSTGKRFMTVNYVLDERRDPIRASHAAAQLLKENYKKLGSWPLAITAYNHGATGMRKAKSKHGNYAAIFQSYRSRTFKFASRNFYSEFLAARQVAADYTTYFGTLNLDHPTVTRTVSLDGYAVLEELSTHFNISPERLKELNPALRPPVYNGQKYVPKGYTLRLPAPAQDADTLLAAIPTSLYKPKQKPSSFYTVQRGDTAGKIARRHNVKLRDLILANNLSRRATIYPRQTLRIPRPGQTLIAKKRPPVKVKTPPAPLLAAKTVAPSEKKAPAAVAVAEPAPQEFPSPILASIIPAPKQEAADPPAEAASGQIPSIEAMTAEVAFQKTYLHNGQTTGVIQVEVEETLGHYAEWADVPTWRIRRLNSLAYGRTLHLHQRVKIPLDRVTAQGFEQNRFEYHKRLQEDFFMVYRINALEPYRIQRGDNYWTLCRDKFEIPMWLMRHCNPDVDFANLRTQQRLMVPAVLKHSETAPESAVPKIFQEVAVFQIDSALAWHPTNWMTFLKLF